MKGSFYEAVWSSLERILGGIPAEGLVGIAGGGALILIFIYQNRTERKKRKP